LDMVWTMRIQMQTWFYDGVFGFVGKITGWATTQVCVIVLGAEHCEYLRKALVLTLAVLILAFLMYGLDWLLRPIFYVFNRLHKGYRWARGIPDEVIIGSLAECEWRGPGTDNAVDNVFFKDVVRARSLTTRKPNHIVIERDGAFARIARSGGRTRQVSRFGQLWEVHEVVSASDNHIRRAIEAAPRLVCLCREMNCLQPEPAIHVKKYTGVDHDLVLNVRGENGSPTWWCCLKTCALIKRLRFGLCPWKREICCRRRKPKALASRARGEDKHPDSDSDVGEMGTCKAECIAWKDRRTGKPWCCQLGLAPMPLQMTSRTCWRTMRRCLTPQVSQSSGGRRK